MNQKEKSAGQTVEELGIIRDAGWYIGMRQCCWGRTFDRLFPQVIPSLSGLQDFTNHIVVFNPFR